MKQVAQETSSIIHFNGRPRKRTKKEKKIWSAFIKYIKEKWELGNDFLSAKVLKEKAQAINELTQSYKNIQEAKEIAHRIEKDDTQVESAELENKDELIAGLEAEIINDIKYLSAVHGTKINMEVTNQLEADSENQTDANKRS